MLLRVYINIFIYTDTHMQMYTAMNLMETFQARSTIANKDLGNVLFKMNDCAQSSNTTAAFAFTCCRVPDVQ